MRAARREPAAIGLGTPSSRRVLIWQLCRRQIWWILFAMATALSIPVLAALSAGALMTLVDEGVIARTEPIAPLAGRLIFLAFLAGVSGFVLNQTIARVFYHLEFELRLWLYERLQAMNPRWLDTVATGQMVTRAMTDLNLMQAFILLIPYMIGYSMVLLGLSIYLFIQSGPLTFVAISAIPVNLYLIMRMRKRLWGWSWLALNRRAQVTTVFDEVVRGARVVKSFGREDEERDRLRGAAHRAYGVTLGRTRLLARFDLLLKVVPTILNAFMLLLAGRLIVTGAVTVGVLVVFLRYSREFLSFARGLDEVVNIWQYAKASAGRILDMITYMNAPVDEPAGVPLPATRTGLEIDGVRMAFGDTTVLDGFALRARPGELVVVTGGPRSGKTTVAALASGELAPTLGRVLVDGAEATSIHPKALRAQVRVVGEEPFLFGRTVRENLQMGAGEGNTVDEAALLNAIRAAGADDFVDDLAHGLDTALGDRGLTLSGGQRQRLALARAVVSPPRILVLDDALMAVNPALEVEILRRIRAHAPDTAIVCLARRDGPATVADHVVHLPGPVQPAESAGTNGGPVVTPEERDERPADETLSAIIDELPTPTDEPRVSDQACAQSDELPGVRSVLKPLILPVVLASGVLLAVTVASLVPTWMFRVAIEGLEEGDAQASDRAAVIILGVGGVLAVLFYYLRIMRKKVEEGVMYLLRRRTFHRLTRLGIDFYDRELPGYVAARVVYDLDRISEFIEEGPFQLASSFTMLALTFVVITVWSPPIAAVGGLFMVLLVLLSVVYLPVFDRAYRRVRHGLGEVVARLQEDFAGRYVIHSFGADRKAHADFYAKSWELRRAQRWALGVTNAYRELITFTLELAAAVVLWRAGNLVLADVLTAGAMVSLRFYLDTALAPVPRLAGVFREYMVAKASIRTLRDPFRATVFPPEDDNAVACPPLDGRIDFGGVAFAYPGTERPVLHEVDLTIEPGETVVLVGPTGAGKSSITKLIARIYDPIEGRVTVDGVDLRTLEVRSYRRRLGIVPQDAFCFRGTVAGNIAYSRPDATRDEIEAAARAVGAYAALAAIPGGFDGVVEEEGRNLTGGQRQLIALARAWVTNPDILLLDEATSALDARLEQEVLEAVRHLSCTTVVVTHRLQVAEQSDRVAVIDRGRIVESGSHMELIGAGGPYARLWSLGDEVDVDAGPLQEV